MANDYSNFTVTNQFFDFVSNTAQVIIWEKFSILLVDRFSCFLFLSRQRALRGVPSYRSWSTGICENFHQDLFQPWDFLRITIEDVKLHHNFFQCLRNDKNNRILDDGDDVIIIVDEEENYIDAVLTMLIGIEIS